MKLFDKFSGTLEIAEILTRPANHLLPIGISTDCLNSPVEGEMHGQKILLAGTNNYLGLTFHPQIKAAAQQALDTFGTGSTGSRMASGTYRIHTELEAALAKFFGKTQTILFTTGYQANLGMISTLIGPDDVLLLDADSHASIYDGARMSSGEVYRFRHNDPTDLAKRLRRLGSRAENALIVLEGIYSMLGDQVKLEEFVAVKKEYGGSILLDEAHSLGLIGPQGKGVAAEAGLLDEIDFIVGTFSKSLGCIGGYCTSHFPELELVRNNIRAYMFTASSAPSVVATAKAALKVLAEGDDLRTRLWQHARKLYGALQDLGFSLGPEPSPVVAVIMDSRERAAEAWQLLMSQGVYVNLVVPPASPNTSSLLRCSLSAAHSDENIDSIIDAYRTVAQKMGASSN